MSTTIAPETLRAVVLVSSFRGDDLSRCQAAFLLMLLDGQPRDAGQIPAECLTNTQTGEFDPHMAGIACASLCSQRLIVSVGRVRSSSPHANGRKCNLYAIPTERRETVRTWLKRRGYITDGGQQEMAL